VVIYRCPLVSKSDRATICPIMDTPLFQSWHINPTINA
jgi:hypothetical protein